VQLEQTYFPAYSGGLYLTIALYSWRTRRVHKEQIIMKNTYLCTLLFLSFSYTHIHTRTHTRTHAHTQGSQGVYIENVTERDVCSTAQVQDLMLKVHMLDARPTLVIPAIYEKGYAMWSVTMRATVHSAGFDAEGHAYWKHKHCARNMITLY
jgi:virulence-associated protein VapD